MVLSGSLHAFKKSDYPETAILERIPSNHFPIREKEAT
jgi:hypothetical protein